MKYTVAALLAAALATTCHAQAAYIIAPYPNATVSPGELVHLVIDYSRRQQNANFSLDLRICTQSGPLAGRTNSSCNDPNSHTFSLKNTSFGHPSDSDTPSPIAVEQLTDATIPTLDSLRQIVNGSDLVLAELRLTFFSKLSAFAPVPIGNTSNAINIRVNGTGK